METQTHIAEKEIAIIQANALPVNGTILHWVLSRKQIVYVLHEIEESVAAGVNGRFPEAKYLEVQLPVIDLEEYYGIKYSFKSKTAYYVVVRATTADHSLGLAIIRSVFPARIRKLNFTTAPLDTTGLFDNSGNILGSFLMDERNAVVIPDIAAIIDNNRNDT